jgi:hypothetical protein
MRISSHRAQKFPHPRRTPAHTIHHMPRPHRIFLLSPAHCGGKRAKLLYRDEARFELAMKLRTPQGAPLAEVFSFLSGLYFRGKIAYARAFANPPQGINAAFTITTNRGLQPVDQFVTIDDLRAMGCVPIDAEEDRYRRPLKRSLKSLAAQIGEDCQVILLGSIATGKYVDILQEILGDRLHFPADFVGRGDMSRGGLMLRCADQRQELTYIPIAGATRKGARPPKLTPRISS